MVGISVIIPFYNSALSIEKVVERIGLVLSKLRFEVIIVDDGSDHLLVGDVLDRVQAKFDYVSVHHQKNMGVSAARNKGVILSKYELVAFCDSDDIWTKDKLKYQYSHLIRGDFQFIGAEKRLGTRRELVKINKFWEIVSWGPHVSSVIMQKSLFLKVGGFNEEFKRLEDGEFMLRLIEEIGRIDCINRNLHKNWKNKRAYGVEGLSSNLIKMYQGELLAVRKSGGIIGNVLIPFLLLKFLKRALIQKLT
jgi:glycosyltransferase involved in cell wall biosynthesis